MSHSSLLTCLVLAGALCLPATPAEKRPIAETDLYDFRWLADPQISPDGSQVAYTLVSVNTKKDGYDTALWIVPAEGGAPRPLTAGPRDSGARWSPDGKRLAFLRSGADAPAPGARQASGQIWILPMAGGEARQLTQMPKGASQPVWSPDGRTIAFGSTSWPAELDKKKDAGDEEPSDVRVITRAAYRMNGGGYAEPDRPSHIWTVPVPEILPAPQKPVQVTTGEFSETDVAWSPDGSRIFFLSNREREPYFKPQDSDVYAIPAKGGDLEKVADIEGPIRAISLNRAGKRMAFIGSLNGKPVRSHSQSDLWVAGLQGQQPPRNLTGRLDYEIGSVAGGDQAPPRGGGGGKPFWSADGRYIHAVALREGRANLQRIDAETGKMDPVTEGDQVVYGYSATPDGSKVAAAISTPAGIGDLFVVDTRSRAARRLTGVNDPLFSALSITGPKTIRYKSFDGRTVEAWLQLPPGSDAPAKHPLILNIHGGPHAAYGYTFDHEFQWMAAKGYAVLYPNPRGSTGYGEEFANIIQYRYPGDDFKDLMAGVDEAIRLGYADPNRLGVTGGSGGGVLTNWTVGHTDRFKAAVSQRSIADWRDFWYTADFTLFQPTWFRGAPWEQEADFKARSPISYVTKINTPLMLIEGEADLRTPPGAGGEQMFRALKYRRVPTVMVRFPGESHELSRSGNPKHRVERLRHILAWFDKYLQGRNITTYDAR